MEVVAQKKIKVAINGFGRIGRNFLRCWEGRKDSLLDVVAINDSGGVKQASHLLKYDSILGTFDADVKVVDDNTISVNGKKIAIVSSRDPLSLPWKAMGIDLVIEGTGVFIDVKGAGKHIEVKGQRIIDMTVLSFKYVGFSLILPATPPQAGAKKVLITAPAKDKEIPTFVCGVNEQDYKHEYPIISNASCTTNCLAPFVKVRTK
jgi:glyceraldehyde-3-phosphate dehydrogenase (NADP+) (phosphorylating)